MDGTCCCKYRWQRFSAKNCILLFTLYTVLFEAESRPFFNSRFYIDEHYVRGYRNSHYATQESKTNPDTAGQDTELRFMSFDREKKTLVENKIDLSSLNQNSQYDDFLLMPLWGDGLHGKSNQRTQYAVLRQQRRLKYKKRVPHGLLGLWG